MIDHRVMKLERAVPSAEARLALVEQRLAALEVKRSAALAEFIETEVQAHRDTEPKDGKPPLEFVYRNRRDEVALRRIRPIAVWYGTTEHYPEPGWRLTGYDLDRQAERTFAIDRIGPVEPALHEPDVAAGCGTFRVDAADPVDVAGRLRGTWGPPEPAVDPTEPEPALPEASDVWPRLKIRPGYAALGTVLDDALDQAQAGKGAARHALDGEAFVDQQIVQLCEWLGSSQGAIFQATKKALESTRLPYGRARAELLGAINYLAAAVIVLDRDAKRPPPF